jgi:misacylated tRNA(Ala) deacylase
MTDNLYQTDSYLQTFDALVTGVDQDNHAVILDRSAFYPGGGGQPYDKGSLSWKGQTLPVIKAKRQGADVLHFIAPEVALPEVGAGVQGQLDWARRYALMRTHTAMHILCGVVFRDFGASVTGGDMDPLEGRMDFEFETMQRELIDQIQAAVDKEVAANRPVRVDILPRQQAFAIPDLIRTKINLLPEGIEQVRVVEIVGLDLQADGGTHVHATGEVGGMRIVDYKSKGKINKRIYIAVEEAG